MSSVISHDYNVSKMQKFIELEFADKVRRKNKFKVLDICCRRFPRGLGVDLHPESNADVRCDAHNLPFRDKSFDLTLCVEGIEHLVHPAKAVLEWVRITKYALCITTQNSNCWRRWLRIPFLPFKLSTSPDHIYMWDRYTFENFFRKILPNALILIGWYDRYLKKTRNLKPSNIFHENIKAFIWIHPETDLYFEILEEAMRLIEFRPPHIEYSDRRSYE